MKKINLADQRPEVLDFAKNLFNVIVSLPSSVRQDDKKRTGVQILLWEPGTRNLMMDSVYKPSEAAKFFVVEKAVRSNVLFHYSSQNSEDLEIMRFSGCITIKFNGVMISASASGLIGEEDVFVSIALLAFIFETSMKIIIKKAKKFKCALPYWCHNKNHYLYKMMEKY